MGNRINKIGIMQGRLSPPVNGKIQAFPLKTWKDEFSLAKECGFELIEWVVGLTDLEQNPIFSPQNHREIIRLQKKYQSEVPIICCDYFMERPLNSEDLATRIEAQGMLIELMMLCPEIGIRYIELPFIGKSGLEQPRSVVSITKLLNNIVPFAEKQEVYILIETSLSPKRLVAFLDQIPSNRIQINYDTGNSAYWGYKPQDEIPVYGHRIGNIHIKDCTSKDYTVPLGKGDVDFGLTFNILRDIGYQGNFVLQTARGDDDLQVAKTSYQFTCHYIQKYLH